MTEYWIDVAGCQRVIRDLRDIVEASNDYQWVDDDLRMVDRHSYAAQESSLTKGDAEKLDEQYYDLLDNKLDPTYEGVIRDLTNCIDAMEEAVDYYVSGDAAMAYESSGATSGFPEYRSADRSSTADIPSPGAADGSEGSGEPSSEPTPSSPAPSYPNPNDPLGDQHFVTNPYELAHGSQG